MNWRDAQKHCRDNYNDLATVENSEDNDMLMALMQQQASQASRDGKDKVWIGLYDDKSAWKWSLDNQEYNTDTEFSNWESEEPDFDRARQNCTKVKHGGFWADTGCHAKLSAVCYDGPLNYTFVEGEMSWQEAQDYCRSEHIDLASVRNRIENKTIFELLQTDSAWIGLHREPWRYWSDQTANTFTYWDQDEPDNLSKNQHCVLANMTTGRWRDARCDKTYFFICQTISSSSTTEPPSTTAPPSSSPAALRQTTLRLKIQTEADVHDPAIQHRILQQLHAELEKKGLSDFKLRWVQRDGQIFHEEQKSEKREG
ncbi:C-type mannose receptor 2-like [Myripristis murdjan]|uniref:C-type mannose receptor 2-like n=1 Tax=Myripristis murdjan TaxID=586833 RepID=UPI001175EE72|nr:C-type mannose receptor 2-like [Myripristis murdjan]